MLEPVRIKAKPPVQLRASDIIPAVPAPSYGRLGGDPGPAPTPDEATNQRNRIIAALGLLGAVAGPHDSSQGQLSQAVGRGAASALVADRSAFTAEQEAFQQRLQDALEFDATTARMEARDAHEQAVKERDRLLEQRAGAPMRRLLLEEQAANTRLAKWGADNPEKRYRVGSSTSKSDPKNWQADAQALDELETTRARLAAEMAPLQEEYDAIPEGNFTERGRVRGRINKLQDRIDELDKERRNTLRQIPQEQYDAMMADRRKRAEAEASNQRVQGAIQYVDDIIGGGLPVATNLVPELRNGVIAEELNQLAESGQLTWEEVNTVLDYYGVE